MSAGADLLAGLDEQQREAVVHAGGPLAVVAGPGTGKTRVITHRVAHLILERGVRPDRIVAVTYSVRAAGELRERLAGLVGPARAAEVNAHTFHALGHGLVRRFADVLGLPAWAGRGADGRRRGSGFVDSAQSRRLLREIIQGKGLFKAGRAQGIDSTVERVRRWFAVFADWAVFSEEAERFAVRAEENLADGKNAAGEALDGVGVAAERERVAMLREAALAQRLFSEECARRGWLTYGDLITLPVRLLRTNAAAGALVRDEWRSVVVDEFQDVNAAMIEFLRLVSPPASAPDLCVVGDDDQSIYEFRGADERSFQRFAGLWRGARVIALEANYRSVQGIIETANSVMSRARRRFIEGKRIRGGVRTGESPAGVGGGAPVCCVQLEHEGDDGAVITALIRREHAERGLPWSSFAVITRSNSQAAGVRAALELEGVPAVSQRSGGAIDDAGVQDVLAWARLIADPDAVYAAMRLMLRPPLSMPLATVQRIVARYRAERSRRAAGDVDAGAHGDLIGLLMEVAQTEPVVARLVGWHRELGAFAAESNAAAVVDRIAVLTGVAHAEVLDGQDRVSRLVSVVALLRFARDRQARLDPPGDIRTFLEYFEDLDESERSLSEAPGWNSVDGDRSDSEREDARDAVRVLTAHGAKGLEFDTVLVPRVSPPHGFPCTSDGGGRSAGESGDVPAGFPDFQPASADAGPEHPADPVGGPKERRLGEERRLFYVACTRAQRRLVLLAKKTKSRTRSTHFFQELLDDGDLRGVLRAIDAHEVLSPDGSALDEHRGALERHLRSGEFAGQPARRAVEAAARAARATLADSCAQAARPIASGNDLAGVQLAAGKAIARLAIIAHVERCGEVPAWIDAGDDEARSFAEGLLARSQLGGAASVGAPGPRLPVPGPGAPLHLSYSYVRDYLDCPRCFYLRHALKLPEPGGRAQVVGTAIHLALERFYHAVQQADAGGQRQPGLQELLEIGRSAVFESWPATAQIDAAQLEQVLAQLRLAIERLHDPRAHVLEVERMVTFPYGRHSMTARIDRIDQMTMPDGTPGFRVVDYKSGTRLKSLVEPSGDNLQLGVYALALPHMFGLDEPPESMKGQVEFWVLSTGERGVLPLPGVKFEKVRERIESAVEGILAGRFDRGKDCRGMCDILGPGDAL